VSFTSVSTKFEVRLGLRFFAEPTSGRLLGRPCCVALVRVPALVALQSVPFPGLERVETEKSFLVVLEDDDVTDGLLVKNALRFLLDD